MTLAGPRIKLQIDNTNRDTVAGEAIPIQLLGEDGEDATIMTGNSNLTDVASAETSFDNIKQPASDTKTGVVELATISEARLGSATKVITGQTLHNFPCHYGHEYLRQLPSAIAKILQSDGTTQVKIAIVGDSWVNATTIYEEIRDYFQNLYGNGGLGYIGFGSINFSGVSNTINGTWTEVEETPDALGVDLRHQRTSDLITPASVITSVGDNFDQVDIHYFQQVSGSAFRYSKNGGSSWLSRNTQGAVGVAGFTTGQTMTSSSLTIELTVDRDDDLIVLGANYINTGNAARVYKLGNGGLDSSEVVAVNATYWQEHLALLDPDIVIYLIGTNDMNTNVPTSTFQTNMETFVNRCRAAIPLVDVLFVSPADNNLTGKIHSIQDYDNIMRTVAIQQQCCHISISRKFGDYTDANTRGLMLNDTHPNANGYTVIANEIIKFLNVT